MPATPPPEPATVSQALRAAMLASGLPAVELARLAGVEQGAIGRFERGDGLALWALDALARALRLELMPAPPAMDVITRSSVGATMVRAADGGSRFRV